MRSPALILVLMAGDLPGVHAAHVNEDLVVEAAEPPLFREDQVWREAAVAGTANLALDRTYICDHLFAAAPATFV